MTTEETSTKITFSERNATIDEFRSVLGQINYNKREINISKNKEDILLEELLLGFREKDTTRVKKTWSRRFIENFLINKSWYNPNVIKEDGKYNSTHSLLKSWMYYEHITLPRRLITSEHNHHNNNDYKRAEPGEYEHPTELYSVWSTPHRALIEWGIGVSMYFHTLRVFSFVLFIAGCISLPNIFFFASSTYDPIRNGNISWWWQQHHSNKINSNNFTQTNSMIPFTLKASAVCSTVEWLECETNYCDIDELTRRNIVYEVINIRGNEDKDTIIKIRRNSCRRVRMKEGLINYCTFIFLAAATVLWSIYEHYLVIKEDEELITTTDYSIQVTNPPPDATDPEEWREFFNKFCDKDKEVVLCTISLNNNQLLSSLLHRRMLRDKLRRCMPNIDIDNEDELKQEIDRVNQKLCDKKFSFCDMFYIFFIRPWLRIFWYDITVKKLVSKIEQYTNKIVELQNKTYNVTDVFITFESEEGQRTALQALQAGKIDIYFQRKFNVPKTCYFRGYKILSVREPSEPCSVRWSTLHVSTMRKNIQRFGTFTLTTGLITFSGYLIKLVRRLFGPFAAGCLTSLANTIVPIFVKLLMTIEDHGSEGSYQSSLYLKITFFRWINTVIMARIITDFTNTLGTEAYSLLIAIDGILISDLMFAPLLRILDIYGNIKKHYIAPRAPTQKEMNLSFKGSFYNLGERYTDFTKVVFVCFFYSALNPVAFFIGSATLVIQYFVDKYCLLRIWKPAPLIGTGLVKTSQIFLSLAIIIGFTMGSYDWATFPFDNVCSSSTGSDKVRVCTKTTAGEASYCCNQDPAYWRGFPFPAIPNKQSYPTFKWMTSEQEYLTQIYGWTSVFAVFFFIVIFFGYGMMRFLISFFLGIYSCKGQDQRIDFSNIPDRRHAYIPELRVPTFPFPLLVCNIDGIDKTLLSWTDKEHCYDFYNMIYDIPYEGSRRKYIPNKDKLVNSIEKRRIISHCKINNPGCSFHPLIFSVVKQWSPKSSY